MNKKQKFKKYIKENWLLWFFLVISISITIFSCCNPRYKTNNKLVENEVKQAQILKRKELENPTDISNALVCFKNDDNEEFWLRFDQAFARDLTTNNYFLLSDTIYNQYLTSNFKEQNTGYVDMYIYFNQTLNNNLLGFNITTYNKTQEDLLYLFYNNNLINSYNINTKLSNRNIEDTSNVARNDIFTTIDIQYDTTNENFINIWLYTNNYQNNYSEGYADGYNKANEENQITINQLNNTIANKDLLIEQMQSIIDRYNGGYNMTDDLFAIAEEPINMAKQILNWDLLGINIWGLVSALITLLLGVWIIKRLI